MQTINDFFNNPFFVLVSGVSILWALLSVAVTAYLFFKGVLPVLWRLGLGLSKRKIAVFAEDEFEDLRAMLVDSRLFKESNIVRITKASIRKAEGCDMFLMQWATFSSVIESILEIKRDSTALIAYARPREIPDDMMAKINQHRNVTVVNFRGRLLNDILVSMITTGYQAK